MKTLSRCCAFVFCLLLGGPLQAYEALIAVASNFKPTLHHLVRQFEDNTGHKLAIVSGSSGKLFAQISHGAPYDVFLSADDALPAKLIDTKKAIAGTTFTYARGQLVLLSANPLPMINAQTLLQAKKLAIANPKVAPYGRATLTVLEKLDVKQRLSSRLVVAENIAQAYQYVKTHNADLGFIALSLLREEDMDNDNQRWLIPVSWYEPIKQDAVLIKKNPVAEAFLTYLKSQTARDYIQSSGYL